MRLQVGEYCGSNLYVCMCVSAKCRDDKRWLKLISGVKCYRLWLSLGPDPGTSISGCVCVGGKFIAFGECL